MSWQKNNTHLPNPHKSFEYLSRCFLFPVCLNKLRQYFVTPTSNHLTSNSSSCTWYLWKDFRLIGDFLFKVYFLRTSFPLKKNPIPWFFGMVKPEVKTWMCHLQDLVGNRFTMVWTCLWTANALVISMEVPWRSRFFLQPWAAPNWCGTILNPRKKDNGSRHSKRIRNTFFISPFSCGSKLFEHSSPQKPIQVGVISSWL